MQQVPVPDTLEEALSPEWLTAALGQRLPGIEVVSVSRGPVVERITTNAQIIVECAPGTTTQGTLRLWVKGYFNDLARHARAAGEPEARFYEVLAPTVGVRTLACVYAGFDAETLHGLVITEDVLGEGGVFLDANSVYRPDQAAQSLEQFAILHAATWSDQRWADVPWLAPRMTMYLEGRGTNEIAQNFDGPIGAKVPSEVRDTQRLHDAYRALVAREAEASPWCVIHGDAHPGNLFLDGEGRPSIVDWQLVQRGSWYLDVGYHIASTLSVEDRRANERDLLRHYLDVLSSLGAPAPSFDDAWQALPAGILHGFYLWGITVQVDPAITGQLLERLGTAAADHQSFSHVDPR